MTRPSAPLVLFALLALAACSKKLEPKECDRLRSDAFDSLNKAQHCNTDEDCRQSVWPGCSKPVNTKSFEALKPVAKNYIDGQCEEPKVDCKPPPEVYCKQGLCTHREKGTPEGAGNTPIDQIKVE